MLKKIAICPSCHTKIPVEGESGQVVDVVCPECKKTGKIKFKPKFKELDFYPLNEPFAYAKVLKNDETMEKQYRIIEPSLSSDEQKTLNFIWETLMKSFKMRLDELDAQQIETYLTGEVDDIISNYNLKMDDLSRKKIFYYIKRESLGYGKIDPIMTDPHIEDVSCDGSGVPIFIYHRKYGSLKTNVKFKNEEELSYFVVRLAQKCGKHISIADPMLDATMPDGSRIQMTLSSEVTTKGSTFTIRKFRDDPFTPPDLIGLNTMSAEMLSYFWLAVENRVNALIAGGTASGKTTILNAMSLFIPPESKIVSIEETREINLPHPNWIPGVSRQGFGEVVNNKMVGEIDMYDLMKAALRQRPEYILVGEIRGQEAYVLFQAMATGHATYSTVHADSAKSLIHRMEGKPINIPRIMMRALDILTIQISTRLKGKRVRRCKQVIEIIDIDPTTKEILTNEVFHWDPVEDKHVYTGKSYVLEGIRARWDMSKDDIAQEIKNRSTILNWMKDNNVRKYEEVGKVVSRYAENPQEFLDTIKNSSNLKEVKDIRREIELERERKKDEAQKIEDEAQKLNMDLSEDLPEAKVESVEETSKEKSSGKKLENIYSNDIESLKSVDEGTAWLLYENGFKSINDLRNVTIKDLKKVRGLKKKKAQEILDEIKNI